MLYRLRNGTLIAIRYQDELFEPIARSKANALGPAGDTTAIALRVTGMWAPVVPTYTSGTSCTSDCPGLQ